MSRALLLAILLVVMRLPAGAAPFDVSTLRPIAPIDIVHAATARFTYIGVDEATRDTALKDIDAFDPKVRTLVWLAFVGSHLSEASSDAPFYSWTGYFYPQIVQALEDAGMSERARIFRDAWAHPKSLLPQLPADFSKDSTFRKIDLAPRFGDKRAFEADMIGYVRTTPVVAARYEEVHAHLTDEDRLDALTGMLVRLPDFYKWETLKTWPLAYRTIELVAMFDGEVINGGVEQFFANSSGDLAPQTAEALRAVGLPQQAATVERGMSLFPQPYPTDPTIRQRALKVSGSDEPSSLDRRLDALTADTPYGLPVRAAMAAYGKRENILPR